MHLPSIRDLIGGGFSDGCVALRLYRPEEQLLSRFTPEAWSQIMPNISTEEDWRGYLASLSSVVVCLMVVSETKAEPVAFVLLSITSSEPLCVSYHGGGWAESLGEVKLYYRAMALLFAHLSGQAVEVHTSCPKSNRRAYRFSLSLGLTLQKQDDERYYFVLPNKEY